MANRENFNMFNRKFKVTFLWTVINNKINFIIIQYTVLNILTILQSPTLSNWFALSLNSIICMKMMFSLITCINE